VKQKVPKINFFKKIREISAGGFIPSITGDHNKAVGMTLEDKLGIFENNRHEHDFIDSTKYKGKRFELKGKRKKSSAKISLITKSPTGGLTNQQLLEKIGKKNKERNSLKTTLRMVYGKGKINKKMRLERTRNTLYIIHNGKKLSKYNLKKIGFKKKLQNLIVVEAETEKRSCKCGKRQLHDENNKHEFFHYNKIYLCLNFLENKIFEVLDSSKLTLDLRLHRTDSSEKNSEDKDPTHDRGNAFRIGINNLVEIYPEVIVSKIHIK